MPESRPEELKAYRVLTPLEHEKLLELARKNIEADHNRKIKRSLAKLSSMQLEPIVIGTIVLARKYKPRERTKWGAIGEVVEVMPGGLDFKLRWKSPGLDKEELGEISKHTYSRL